MPSPEAETKPIAATQSVLGHVFDHYQNMMQISRCIREVSRQRGASQPRVLELSRLATNLPEYLPEAQLTRYITHNEPEEPSLSAPVSLPFAAKSFDVCFVTDSYEHIPRARRPELLSEMCRVTDGLVLVGMPVESELVTRVDRLIFDLIWCKYAVRFNPIEQHIEYGLEPKEAIIAHLKALGAERVVALPGNFVYRHIHQILLFFELQYDNPLARELYEPVNRVYNEFIGGQYDYREPCYRYLLAVTTDPHLNLEEFEARMKAAPETPALMQQAEGVLVEAFRAADARAVEELKARIKELNQLKHELWLRDNDLARLAQEAAHKDAAHTHLQQELIAKDEGIAWLRHEIALRDTALAQAKQEVTSRDDESSRLKHEAALKDEDIVWLRQELALRDAALAQANHEIASKEDESSRLRHEAALKDEEIVRLSAQVEQFDYWGGRMAGGLYRFWKFFLNRNPEITDGSAKSS